LKIAWRRGFIKDSASIALNERHEVIASMIGGLISGLDKRDG